MKWKIKYFDELTLNELWDIYHLRNQVFIIEQQCIYQDIDEYDKKSYHIMVYENNRLIGYTRVLPPHSSFEEVSLGRVISLKRRSGLGTQLITQALEIAKACYHATKVEIEAQVYVKEMYEKLGFIEVGEVFLEDGIAHVKMIKELL